ncbi:MAG: hypothetical protein JWN70_4670 [Planctomycetaceae bacterium]|nr:hypothetical protein [Planctomycetaceae bacterium]
MMRCLLLALPLLLCSCKSEKSKRMEAQLQPAIRYVEAYLKEHRGLPTESDFIQANEGNAFFILRRHTDKYAASKGAKSPNDYMIGVWRGEWFHYYKSWDHRFLNATDEILGH